MKHPLRLLPAADPAAQQRRLEFAFLLNMRRNSPKGSLCRQALTRALLALLERHGDSGRAA